MLFPTMDGNQGPVPRAWPVKVCCRGGLSLYLISPQNCGPRGTGLKQDGFKMGWAQCRTGRKQDGLNRGNLKTRNPKSPFPLSLSNHKEI